MKILYACALCTVALFVQLNAGAQDHPFPSPNYNKPLLFSDLPQIIQLKMNEVETVLQLPVGTSVKSSIADNFILEGTVVSGTNTAEVRSVVIRSTNRPGAVCTLTRVTQPNGTFRYLGRMMSLKNGDAYQLVSNGSSYTFEKKNLYDLISD